MNKPALSDAEVKRRREAWAEATAISASADDALERIETIAYARPNLLIRSILAYAKWAVKRIHRDADKARARAMETYGRYE